jgi:hypothetical protein
MTIHTVYVYAILDYDWEDLSKPKSWRTDILAHKADDTETRVFLRELRLKAKLLPDFNPVPAQVAALKAQRKKALAEYTKSVAEINDRLSKLLCIEAPQAADDGKEFA